MRLASVRIENLRGFCDETIPFNDYTCLVGANGAGKSTILTALNIFFRENVGSLNLHKLDRQDFHRADTKKPIRITVEFTDLSREAQADFSDYYRQDKLIVTAVAEWDEEDQCAEVKQFGQRMVMREFAPFFKAEGDGELVGPLKEIYKGLRERYQDLPTAGTKPAMLQALRDYETKHPELCELMPSEDQFYGVTKGENRLRKHIQWVYVPAVKDAATEQAEGKATALGALLERTVRSKVSFDADIKALRKEIGAKYGALLERNQTHLTAISESLKARLQGWTHPGTRVKVEWQQSEKSVAVSEPLAEIIAGEGVFDGSISRFGHGLQRSFLLAILQELVSIEGANGPKLILGCEEPELYQHPPQARHLSSVLQKLSKANAQIIVSTHSPYFVSGQCFEDVRLIRKSGTTHESCAEWVDLGELAAMLAAARGQAAETENLLLAKVHQALQPSLNEMFFAPVVVFVEGIEDAAYLSTYLALADRLDEFRSLGCHIVPVNGKDCLIQPIAIANLLKIPVFVVLDSDAHSRVEAHRQKHEADNRAILRLMGHSDVEPLPAETVWKSNLVLWKDEIGKAVSSDIGEEKCRQLRDEVRTKHKMHGRGSLNKNPMFIGHVLTEAASKGMQSSSLQRLCDLITAFGKAARPTPVAVPAADAPAIQPQNN